MKKPIMLVHRCIGKAYQFSVVNYVSVEGSVAIGFVELSVPTPAALRISVRLFFKMASSWLELSGREGSATVGRPGHVTMVHV